MNTVDLILSQNPDFKFVKCIFASSVNKEYTYKTMKDVGVDDFVIVVTPSNGMQVVKVTDVIPAVEAPNFAYEIKWIVDVVHLEEHEALKDMERETQKACNKAEARQRSKSITSELTEMLGEEGVQEVTKLVRL